MNRCSACGAATAAEQLTWTAEGKLVCSSCFAAYQNADADSRARAAAAFRRCRCGVVVAPHLEKPIPAYDADGDLDIQFFFQPDSYHCTACGRSFTVRHGVVTYFVATAFAGVGAGAYFAHPSSIGDFGPFGCLVFVVLGVGFAVFDLVARRLHPRVY